MNDGRTVLLLMDLQRSMVGRFPGGEELAGRLGRVADAARGADVGVMHVRVAFRPGHPEVSTRNVMFGAIAASGALTTEDPATEIHPLVGARPEEPVVTKVRVSAFAGSDLDVLLRAWDARTLVLAGIATSGVVLSTLRQAADLDYRLVVLSDGCLDNDEEVHRVLLSKVFPRQATVTTTDEWVATLTVPSPAS